MRVLLVSPPFYRLMGSHFNGLNLGLSYIASSLEQQGHEVMLYNADYLPSAKYANQNQLFNSFEHYKEALDTHECWEVVRLVIQDLQPDVVGITMHTGAYRSAKNVALIARSINSEIKIVVGGPHPTLAWQEMLGLPWLDTIVSGEGENIRLRKNKRSTKGHQFKRLRQPDIDKIPFPMRDSFINSIEFMDLGNIITGRGCPNKCTYCASPAIWGGKYRLRDIENVIDELKEMKKLRVKVIRFCDDTFNLQPDRTALLLQRMMEERIDLP